MCVDCRTRRSQRSRQQKQRGVSRKAWSMVGMSVSVRLANDDGARHTTYDNVPMRRGFTLLDLTLVTTIAGVIMALAIPRFIHIRDTIAVRGAIGELGAAFS